MAYLNFKDVSTYQGKYNVAADPDPILAMKASGGDAGLYLDAELDHNYAATVKAGKVPIMYHFAGGGDPTVEASYFISAVSPLAVGDVYALDWEIDHANPVAWVQTFMTHVHTVTGVWPLIYMDISRLNAFPWGSVLSTCGLWLAAPSYGFDETIPGVHDVYVAQQGPIVNGVDTDAWFGTIAELKDYGYHAPTTAPAPVVPPAAPSPPVSPPVVPTSTDPTVPEASASGEPEHIPVTITYTSTGTKTVVVQPTENVIEKDVKMVLGKYNKLLVAIAGLVVTFLLQHYGSSPITKDVVLALTALGVYQTPNVDL